jgi:hypothetical protein
MIAVSTLPPESPLVAFEPVVARLLDRHLDEAQEWFRRRRHGGRVAGQCGHVSRLTESPTRVEVTETTRYAVPRHHRRQTAQTVPRPRRSSTAEERASRSVNQRLSVIRVACHPAARAAASISGAPSLGSP